MGKYPKIYLAGHLGMVGSAIYRELLSAGHPGDSIITRSRNELDLTDQKDVRDFFYSQKPDQVYIAAAMVGGINANNTFPAEFIYTNLMIETNIIHSAFLSGVRKLLFLGSSCIYPRDAAQPISEKALLTGRLEPTNEAYAIAKIAGIKLCESYNRQYGDSHNLDYRSVMPTNLYGPNDNYHPEHSHVIPALIGRFHTAKQAGLKSVSVWGTGQPKREFLHVDDLAKACLIVMNASKASFWKKVSSTTSHLNVGPGQQVAISELAKLISETVGYCGDIVYDTSKPDGAPLKMMTSEVMRGLGWRPAISLREGLSMVYQNYLMETHEQ